MIGQILFIFMSLSFRSSILVDMPNDYEVRAGFESSKMYADVLFEREIGITGLGADLRYESPFKVKINDTALNTELEWYLREVKSLDYESVRVTYPIKAPEAEYNLGLSINSSYWSDPKVMGVLKVKMQDWFNMTMETDFETRDIISIKLSKKITLRKKDGQISRYYIEPLMVYKAVNDNVFWQFKIAGGFKL